MMTKRTWQQAARQERRGGDGGYAKGYRCHMCGSLAGENYGTHPCAGGGDGPGFLMCSRAACWDALEGLSAAQAVAEIEKRLAARGVDAWGNRVDTKGGAA